LYDGLAEIHKREPGTLSIPFIEDDSNEDVTYVMGRFADKATFDAHMRGIASAKVGFLVKEVVKLRGGGILVEK
jgi:quinol monooxygenase YgiN